MVCTANEIERGHHTHQTVQLEPMPAFTAAWNFVLYLQPVEFTAGLDVGSGGTKQPAGEGAGGLFSGASGPKPPAALSQAVLGMKPGGKVSETPMPLMSFSSDKALVCGKDFFSSVLPMMFNFALASSFWPVMSILMMYVAAFT